MQLTYTTFALGLATLASAGAKREFVFPDTVPMHKRQTSGPAYQCHSDCGYTILNAKDAGYCDTAEWKSLLENCLECANTYELWPDYGNGVEAAAKACGIDAVPKGSSGTGAASSVASSTGAAATTAASSSAAATTTANSSSAAPASTSSAAGQSSAVETSGTAGTSAPVTSAATGASAAETSTPATQTVSGASSNMISGVLALGAALIAAASLM